MIKQYDDNKLASFGIEQKKFLFCQVWKELTDKRTFDSYQYKLFNVVDGTKELIHNIERFLENLVTTTHSIDAVTGELIKEIKRDYVLLNKFNGLKNSMLSTLGSKYVTNSNYKAYLYKMKFYLHELEMVYDDTLIDCLCDSIDTADSDNIIKLTSIFISRCVNQGWSARALYNKIDSNSDDIKNFLKKIYNFQEQNYAVIFPFRLSILPPTGKTKDESRAYVIEQMKKFNILVYAKEKLAEEFENIDTNFLNNNEYMVVRCVAKDIFTASHNAITEISNTLNMFSFFSVIEPWNISNQTWIVFNCDHPYTKNLTPNDIYETYEYLDSSSNVYSRVEKITNSNSSEVVFVQKLLSSFNYATMSKLSVSVEEKFINMWIAIESLSRLDSHDNIIGNIIINVSSACSIRYVYKEIRNFIEDCFRCEISLDFDGVVINRNEPNKELLVQNILNIFRDNTLYAELHNRCSTCALLKHRCEKFHALLNDEKQLINQIKSHHQTIRWHLDRLYRIRNEIAHSANKQFISVVSYTEHLYDYLATYISELARFSIEKGITNMGELSTAIIDNYNQFLFLADEKKLTPKRDYLKKLWTVGIMDYI